MAEASKKTFTYKDLKHLHKKIFNFDNTDDVQLDEICTLLNNSIPSIVNLVNRASKTEDYTLTQCTLLKNQLAADTTRLNRANADGHDVFVYTYSNRLATEHHLLSMFEAVYRKQFQRLEKMREMMIDMARFLQHHANMTEPDADSSFSSDDDPMMSDDSDDFDDTDGNVMMAEDFD